MDPRSPQAPALSVGEARTPDNPSVDDALRQSEERYRHIFSTAGVSIWEQDYSAVQAVIAELRAEGVADFRAYFAAHPDVVQRAFSLMRVVDLNDASLELMRARNKEELLASLEQTFTPDSVPGFTEVLVAIVERSASTRAETVMQALDGAQLRVLFTIVFPSHDEPLRSVLVSIVDITERHRLEQELQRSRESLLAAQQLSHVGSWTRHVQSGEIIWSAETSRIFGREPATPPLTLQQARDAWHPDDRANVERLIQTATNEKRSWETEFRIVRPDGSIRHIHGKGQPVLDASHEIVEWMGVVMDVTDRKRAERMVRRAREQLIEARFTAMLAERTRLARELHDTLLQDVTGVALQIGAVAGAPTCPPQIKSALLEVAELAQRTLLEARRAVWDLRAPNSAPDGLASAVRTAVDIGLRSANLELTFDVDGIPRPVDSDVEATVTHVIQEAILNVVKHAEARAVMVKLSFGRRRINVSVIDDGRGFATAPDPSESGGHWGLLGMRERAAQVRGRCAVHSTPGVGTEVALSTPYRTKRSIEADGAADDLDRGDRPR